MHFLNILQVLNNSLRSGCRTLFAYIVNLDLIPSWNEPAYLKSREIVGLSLPTFYFKCAGPRLPVVYFCFLLLIGNYGT